MTLVNVYLTFNGNCEEAFNLYKSVFGGESPYVADGIRICPRRTERKWTVKMLKK